jgi:hypothetical protein
MTHLTAADILGDLGLRVKSSQPGRYYTTCPQCSHTRQESHQRLKCLGVTIDNKGVKFGCNHCGWTGGQYYENARAYRSGSFRATRPERVHHLVDPHQRVEPQQRSTSAVRLWCASTTARGSLAERYLTKRKLALPDDADDVLRFHPSCPFGPGYHPCMVALYRDIRTNEPRAIHRTALTASGDKIDRKFLGPKGGCAIKLSVDENVTQGLTVSEGIETALAGMALSFQPAWALGDANELARFPVLSGIECLTILVDNDKSGTGQAAALECSRRWTRAGREVFRVVPNTPDTDMADVVRERVA